MTAVAKILVVDDEASIRFFLQEALERVGYHVTSAENGEMALQYAQTELFDLALIDLRLPGMDGMQVLKTLRQTSPDTAIIVLTAHASLESAVEALHQGAHDYLFKPCKKAELLESVSSGLLKRQRELRRRLLLSQLERDLSDKLEEIRATVDNHPVPPVALESQETSEPGFTRWKTLLVDFNRHVITLDDTQLDLSRTEFNLLAYLAGEAPRVVSSQELVREVLGYESEPREARDLARYHIYRIRQKVIRAVGRDDLIRTVHGVGYALAE